MAESEFKPDDEAKSFKCVISVDGKEFKVDTDYMNGAQIKALAGTPSGYQLFLEQNGEDKPIGDAESIDLHNGMHFYSIPPATFGQ